MASGGHVSSELWWQGCCWVTVVSPPPCWGSPEWAEGQGPEGFQVLLPWEAQGCLVVLGEHTVPPGHRKGTVALPATADTSTNGDVQPLRWT